jgi:hypothetical protein
MILKFQQTQHVAHLHHRMKCTHGATLRSNTNVNAVRCQFYRTAYNFTTSYLASQCHRIAEYT